MEQKHKHANLEDRLIAFGVGIVNLGYQLQKFKELKPISDQILRSGISPALNYGEALHAESKKDFIHKMKIALKELHETLISLKILSLLRNNPDLEEVKRLKKENGELVAIFISSVRTAKRNSLNK
ncbi:MAG: four helix bundle protein [Bacteroidetes bacterium]|nr:four helix bundle protein [Bacteroidota bacterium]MCK5766526.1 four helix bundle protein [Bacteroidales bacterium]